MGNTTNMQKHLNEKVANTNLSCSDECGLMQSSLAHAWWLPILQSPLVADLKRAPTKVLRCRKQINKSGTKLQDSHCAAAFYMRMTSYKC